MPSPSVRGSHGLSNEDCTTVWFLGRKWNSIVSPISATTFSGSKWRPLLAVVEPAKMRWTTPVLQTPLAEAVAKRKRTAEAPRTGREYVTIAIEISRLRVLEYRRWQLVLKCRQSRWSSSENGVVIAQFLNARVYNTSFSPLVGYGRDYMGCDYVGCDYLGWNHSGCDSHTLLRTSIFTFG
jgi:hypothetical protein